MRVMFHGTIVLTGMIHQLWNGEKCSIDMGSKDLFKSLLAHIYSINAFIGSDVEPNQHELETQSNNGAR